MRGMTNANSGGKVEVGEITFQDMSKKPASYHLCNGKYYTKESYPEYWKMDNSELCLNFYELNSISIEQNAVVNPPIYSNTPAFTQDGKGQV